MRGREGEWEGYGKGGMGHTPVWKCQGAWLLYLEGPAFQTYILLRLSWRMSANIFMWGSTILGSDKYHLILWGICIASTASYSCIATKTSRTSLFRTRLIRNPRYFEVKLIPLRLTVTWCQLGYFETPLFRTIFDVPWDFVIAAGVWVLSTKTNMHEFVIRHAPVAAVSKMCMTVDRHNDNPRHPESHEKDCWQRLSSGC